MTSCVYLEFLTVNHLHLSLHAFTFSHISQHLILKHNTNECCSLCIKHEEPDRFCFYAVSKNVQWLCFSIHDCLMLFI